MGAAARPRRWRLGRVGGPLLAVALAVAAAVLASPTAAAAAASPTGGWALGNTTTTTTTTTSTVDRNRTTTMKPIPFLPEEVTPTLHTTLTVLLLCLTLLLTGAAGFQMSRLVVHGHKKQTYFNLCLSLCVVWGVLRATLLGIYAVRQHVASLGGSGTYIVLFVLPNAVQFAILSIVVLYFCEVSLKGHVASTRTVGKRSLRGLCVFANLAFFVTNTYCAAHIAHKPASEASTSDMMKIRVVVTEVFTLTACLALVISTFTIRRLLRQKRLVQGQGLTLKQVMIFTAVIFPLFMSRFVYNMVAISETRVNLWGYRWTYLSDETNRRQDDTKAFVFFIMVLFLWEILPLCIFIWFFRVPRQPRAYKRLLQSQGLLQQPQTVQFSEHNEDGSSEDEEDDFSVGPGMLPGSLPSLGPGNSSYQLGSGARNPGAYAAAYASYPPQHYGGTPPGYGGTDTG